MFCSSGNKKEKKVMFWLVMSFGGEVFEILFASLLCDDEPLNLSCLSLKEMHFVLIVPNLFLKVLT